MRADLALLDLRLRRRSLLAYTIGIAVYAALIVMLYPTFKDDTSLNDLTANSSTLAALFGASGPLTTSSGWLNANLYANFVPLVVLLVGVGYGAACIAGQAEDGTLGMVTTLPVARGTIVTSKATNLLALVAPVAIITALCVAAGHWFDLTVSGRGLAGVTIGVILLGVDFGLLAMLIGAKTGSRSTALGVASGIAAASYLVNSLAPAVHWVHPLRHLSAFYYAVGDDQLTSGLRLAHFAVLALACIVLLTACQRTFQRLDVP